ncbi:methyl-accepting chemotaxis protein [Phaeobacter gallaeciensis]|uniref:Methyl-accepting chemotaxis protein n=1 Tax=Phaeobacter gallaeciensis TaxID=60890 RepID=A0A1B0ZLX2_9RHOB|nr:MULTISPECIES: methyl-accepting chemotaxis protein [Phaeobacter]MDF1771405.1 methyl-accepting chemotaxis protein [Pseudophaeobacter sp. bin_em_oilr2.035]MEE2634597.1 methyl-accepting chemotaxis protein [Pseudomonadota bacterium]ANP35162.1 methyl-accepting chemotaxis protein [Phaeobacter gallaeciensis]MDE4061890.1 methyl-accepting chemotaxis protein [Phaeobacter gallaeciensis]MDE4124922.1 methyl-accepting chemotaxis protein [Phaeobacter gallaeciensis]
MGKVTQGDGLDMSTVTNSSDKQFQRLATLVLLPAPALVAYFVDGAVPWWLMASLSGALGLLTWLSKGFSDSFRDYVIAFCYIGHSILFTTSFTGHAWQIDSHMLFFASLAVVSTLYSPGAVIFATVLVAVHHLAFSLMLPSLVFPGGSVLASIERTVMHAVILLLEAGILLMSIYQRQAARRALEEQQQALQEEAAKAEEAEEEALRSKRDSENVVMIFDESLKTMAAGNLSGRITGDFPHEYESMRDAFNELAESLNSGIGTAMTISGDFRNDAHSVSEAVQSLSARTESQAATLTETTAALQELSESVKKSAADSGKAAENARTAYRGAVENGDLMSAAVDAMGNIEQSSNEISTIINVIEDISFQTNLLALNAGVEAARAGESGRGFAVVAAEVRALAQRTADAANEVKSLIGTSAKQVKEGSELVNKAGDALQDIVARVSETNKLIEAISGTSTDQASALSEMASALSTLDGATQTNAAMVEEMTAMSMSMDSKARELAGTLSRFELDDQQSGMGGAGGLRLVS